MRLNHRANDQLRAVQMTRNYMPMAEGAVLIEMGNTKVICTASVIPGVPLFLKGSGSGWVTAEYGMLPRSTVDRMPREAAKGKQSGRTQEIQRLIGRALRAAVDLKALQEHTITIDCDVIQADGGTRTAAITGGCVALYDAVSHLQQKLQLSVSPFKQLIAAVSVGIYQGQHLLDLDYPEDAKADTDMNLVMTASGGLIEIQGTAEQQAFDRQDLNSLLSLGEQGANTLINIQKSTLGLT